VESVFCAVRNYSLYTADYVKSLKKINAQCVILYYTFVRTLAVNVQLLRVFNTCNISGLYMTLCQLLLHLTTFLQTLWTEGVWFVVAVPNVVTVERT